MKNKILLSSAILFAIVASTCIASSDNTTIVQKELNLPAKRKIKIKISRETTFVDDLKLRPDGTPDYIEWYNRRYSKGITPQSNAARDLIRVFGLNTKNEFFSKKEAAKIFKYFKLKPGDILTPGIKLKMRDLASYHFYTEEGITEEDGKIDAYKYFKPFHGLSKKQKGKFLKAFRTSILTGKPVDPKIMREWEAWLAKPSMRNPAKDKSITSQFPDFDKNDPDDLYHEQWGRIESRTDIEKYPIYPAIVAGNSTRLALLIKASRKPKLYFPVYSTGNFMRFGLDLFELGSLLHQRANLRLKLGAFDKALKDLKALKRIAKLLNQMPSGYGIIHCQSFKGYIHRAILFGINNCKFSKAQLKKLKSLINSSPKILTAQNELQFRVNLISRICKLLTYDKKEWKDFFLYSDFLRKNIYKISTQRILSDIEKTPADQLNKILKSFVSQYKDFDKNLDQSLAYFKYKKISKILIDSLAAKSRKKRASHIAFRLGWCSHVFSTFNAIAYSNKVYYKATNVILALEIYRHDHKKYPDNLKVLVPKYLKKIPRDPFTVNRTITYKKVPGKNEYYLYSADYKGKIHKLKEVKLFHDAFAEYFFHKK